ncbi:IclR family transcriptional regulator [Streptomyces sp. NPDC021356]|uniref:IclR family transcriptional regulator n=1 Tax=Streptomyces sp. NPDC021356 TaxID=3154900 RepID=UPI0033F7179B
MSQAVERAVGLLEMLSEGPQHPAAVAERFGVHRTTVLRLLRDLCEGGLARRRPDGTYAVGYRLAGLAQAAVEQFDLRSVAHPFLLELCRRVRLTVHLAALDDGRVIYADKVEPPGTVRLYAQIGRPVVLHTSGVGKAILAFLPDPERASTLEGHTFERFTDTTITDAETLAARLDTIRSAGWAEDDGEYEPFVNCVAVPVRDGTGAVRAAVSLAALRARMDLPALRAHLPALRQAARGVSRELGWTR